MIPRLAKISALTHVCGVMGLMVSLSGCGGGMTPGSTAERLTAGGATFPDPIIQHWARDYDEQHRVQIDYIKSGSGKGIGDLTAGTVDFGCTDAPMTREERELAETHGGPVLHIPITMGSVAIIYHVSNVPNLRLSGPVLADIYLGKITRWNDPAIQSLNETVTLPNKEIIPVQRAESSGTTSIFSDYLTKVSPEFQEKIGASKKMDALKDVTGQKGNDGIAGFVENNAGAIGYVELAYAVSNTIPLAQLRNKAGVFVSPSARAASAAAQAALTEPKPGEPFTLHDLTYSLTNAGGAESYPIVGMSYAILYEKMPPEVGPIAIGFLKWAVTEGQAAAEPLHYAPLPEELQKKCLEKLDAILLK
ncbi:MAG: phosphate ABC transporter substrate-binding protein PstS [Bacteroidales bacterium]|nr:phosphate ABC transporter substrate-binding protein PstS [Bacteroidales bacterium]